MTVPDSVVTSWSPEGGALYGDRFVSSFDNYWGEPFGIPLKVRTDTDLLEDPGVRGFRKRERDSQTDSDDPCRGALKWSWKVFAMASPPLARSGWMVWIDGDVEFTAPPTEEFFDTVCPAGADVSFLGRPWAYSSETGFVAFNMRSGRVHTLLERMRYTYISGQFRVNTRMVDRPGKPPKSVGNWGDAAVFDHCRADIDLVENDLAKDCRPGNLHVWPQTVLGSCMSHQKGPTRKRRAYGGAV